jgi:putative transposase
VQEWIAAVGAKTAYIERGSPWDNGYIESFNARLRDELLNGEIFYTLREAQILIESWRRHYKIQCAPAFAAWPAALRRPAAPATLAQPPTLN